MRDPINLRDILSDCDSSGHTATGVLTWKVRALVAAVRAALRYRDRMPYPDSWEQPDADFAEALANIIDEEPSDD